MNNNLTIIIPCKNEEKYIGKCLKSISDQNIKDIRIIIADNNSTDKTIEIISQFNNLLIEVIPGGLPAIARNNGANISKTDFLLFIDADAEFYSNDIIEKSIKMMESKNLHLLSAKLNSKFPFVKILYMINNFITFLSKYDKPFCVGMYMMVRRDVFNQFNGFPEDVKHCEDYLLSKKFDCNKFGIIDRYVYSDNRRFKKMGYFNMIKYIAKNIIKRNDYNYFKKEINYWK